MTTATDVKPISTEFGIYGSYPECVRTYGYQPVYKGMAQDYYNFFPSLNSLHNLKIGEDPLYGALLHMYMENSMLKFTRKKYITSAPLGDHTRFTDSHRSQYPATKKHKVDLPHVYELGSELVERMYDLVPTGNTVVNIERGLPNLITNPHGETFQELLENHRDMQWKDLVRLAPKKFIQPDLIAESNFILNEGTPDAKRIERELTVIDYKIVRSFHAIKTQEKHWESIAHYALSYNRHEAPITGSPVKYGALLYITRKKSNGKHRTKVITKHLDQMIITPLTFIGVE